MSKGKKKVIIIGSGIGGSGVGALLQHTGKYDVEIFERNNLIGGRFASYNKDGFRLDIGCHLIANCDKGTLGEICRVLGQPEAVKWRYAQHPSPVFNFMGNRIRFPKDMDKMGFAPEELQTIMQFYSESLAIPEGDYAKWDKVNMKEHLDKYITTEKARAIFGMMAGVYFVIPDVETPVGEWVMANKLFMNNMSSGYPIGGTGAIPEAYVRIMKEDGGKLHLNKSVKKIIIENGVAKGIELKDGSVHKADIIISNAGLKPTLNSLVGKEHYSQDFVTKVNYYSYSLCTLMVKVALDTKFVEKETMVLYIGSDDMNKIMEETMAGIIPEVAHHCMIPIISNMDPNAAPEGKQLLIVGGSAGIDPLSLTKEQMDKYVKSYLNVLEVVFPGISRHIMWTDVTTPIDINNLFGEDGNVIGISQKVGQVQENRPPLADPEIKNLYHCSADSGMHGIGGELAADSALNLYRLLS